MPKNLSWNFNFTPLRDADSLNSGSSRTWGDLGNNIDALTKKMQKWSSDPYDKQFKENFAQLSPEEQLAVMQRGDFIPAEYANKVSPEMLDKYRLTDPNQSLLWQNALAQMNQQKQAAEIQKYKFGREQLADNKTDAIFNNSRDAFALQREWEDAVASGNPEYQQQVRNKYLDWQQQQINQNPHLTAPAIPTHKAGLDEMNAHQQSENTWNATVQNQRVDALIPELVQILGGAAPGSDAANVILERMQQSSTPEQWHDITLAYQRMMNSGLMAHTTPSLMATAQAAEDAENASLMGGGTTGNVVGNSVVGSTAINNPNQTIPSLNHGTSGGIGSTVLPPLTNNATKNAQNSPIKIPSEPSEDVKRAIAFEEAWRKGDTVAIDALANKYLENKEETKIPPNASKSMREAVDFSKAWKNKDTSTINALGDEYLNKRLNAAKTDAMNRLIPDYSKAWAEAQKTGDFSKVRAMENRFFDTSRKTDTDNGTALYNPRDNLDINNSKEDKVGIDFDAYRKGVRVTDKAEDMTYGQIPTTIPVSQMRLGQITDKLQPALIAETKSNPKYKIYREKNGKKEKVGTSAVGIGQFLKGTIEDLAPKVFGKDWKNVIFTRENQEKLLRATYDQALKSQQVPGVVWEGLEKNYGGKKGFEWVRMKGGFKYAPSYEKVRELILETESKKDEATPAAEQKPKKSYSQQLPDVLTGFFTAAEKLQNGERSDELTSFMNAAKSNKSALDILNEYAKANVSLKYGKDDSKNTFPFEPGQFQTLVNSTREDLAKEGIPIKAAQVAQLVINNVKLEQGKFGGWGDKIKIDKKALLNQTREMYKLSIDPERQLTERIHNEYISVAPLVERFHHLNSEIAKLESRAVQNSGSKRQLDKAKQMREELAKQATEQLHKLQGSWGLTKLSNQGY